MNEREMISRTKQFALRVLKVVEALPDNKATRVIANQLGRCGTSVGANYRAACRGRSKAEFIAKLGIVEEEADESMYWIELLIEGNIIKSSKLKPLHDEANQLVAIIAASRRTAMSSSNRKSQIANRK
jgi:four helix bundle protein